MYIKDLNRLGRDLSSTIILDNSPASYCFNVENAVPIKTWFNDPYDTELLDLLPIFESLSKVKDVRKIIKQIINKMSQVFAAADRMEDK